MKRLLYVGKFKPWNDAHEDELFEALDTFDEVTICVATGSGKPIMGQPTKILNSVFKDRIKIIHFNKLSNLLHIKSDNKYIMFER